MDEHVGKEDFFGHRLFLRFSYLLWDLGDERDGLLRTAVGGTKLSSFWE